MKCDYKLMAEYALRVTPYHCALKPWKLSKLLRFPPTLFCSCKSSIRPYEQLLFCFTDYSGLLDLDLLRRN